MPDFDKESVVRHIRGATVVHQRPFSSLQVPSAPDVLSIEECEKWVVPFYRVSFRSAEKDVAEPLKVIYQEITPNVVERLLTEFDWRPRLTGAFFAALKRFTPLETWIGQLLLRSDLCFAGKFYCVALVEFNTPDGTAYLRKYLEYYLTRPDLDYNQGDAMGALAYADAIKGTKYIDTFRPLWDAYVCAKTWKPDLDMAVSQFSDEMATLHKLRAAAESSS